MSYDFDFVTEYWGVKLSRIF